MTPEQIRKFIEGSEWISITTEVRPSITKSASGTISPFYCSRIFRYPGNDRFECVVTNYADPNGKVPLVMIAIAGHILFQGPHPLAEGAHKLDYVADTLYDVTPLHQGFADAMNKIASSGFEKWEISKTQSVLKKEFVPFGLLADEVYVDYDLIFVCEELLFNGSKNVDGRPFDQPENRPTNLQVPLVRR